MPTEPSTPGDGYRPTFFDRLGPDAGSLMRAAGSSTAVAVIGAGFGALGAVQKGGGARAIVAWSIGIGIGAGALTMFVTLFMSRGASAGVLAFIQPSGSSTPSESQFSYQDALAARGDTAGALASYEELLRLAPSHEVAVRLRAADLYADSKVDAGRAAALYREAQRIPTVSSSDYLYATNRLISLYMGVLADPGKAMVELRRLIDRYPASGMAAHARTALADLKRDMHGDD